MNNLLAKIIIYIYPLNLKLAGIFNLTDLFIVGLFKLNHSWLYIAGTISTLLTLSAFQIVFYNREIAGEILYVPFKIALIFLYISLYIRRGLQINRWILLITLLPLLISIAGFLFPQINAAIVGFYGLTESQSWRYGGVFGQDVNSLGMYSSLCLILLYVSKSTLKLSLFELFFGASVCLGCIVVSGMRSGLIALIISLFFVAFFYDSLRRKIFVSALLYVLPGIFLAMVFVDVFIDEAYYSLLSNRFSFDSLLKDFDTKEDGNLSVSISYFGSVVSEDFDLFLIMFGYDSSLIFVDNFFVFLFIKYGVLGLILTALFFFYIYKKARYWDRLNNSKIGLFFVIYTAVISLKGIFPIAGYYVFLIILSMSAISQNSESIK